MPSSGSSLSKFAKSGKLSEPSVQFGKPILRSRAGRWITVTIGCCALKSSIASLTKLFALQSTVISCFCFKLFATQAPNRLAAMLPVCFLFICDHQASLSKHPVQYMRTTTVLGWTKFGSGYFAWSTNFVVPLSKGSTPHPGFQWQIKV